MILIVGNFLSATRATRSVCEELAERLMKKGTPVITTSRLEVRLFRLLDMMGTAWRRRHEYQVALVEVYSGMAFRWAEMVCWVLRLARKPYVLALHGGNLPIFAKGNESRVRRLLSSAEKVVVPSRYLLEGMVAFRSDILLIPNAIDLGKYPYQPRSVPRPLLVWLRAFHQIYNPMLAPRVIAKLVPEYSKLELQMIGPDKHDGSFENTKEISERLNVSSHIHFVGSIQKRQVADKLNECDILINTTNVDNTPVSVMEAMACGLCVVSTAVGGIPYLLTSEEDSLLVPPDDPEAMAHAVKRILSEHGLASRLSQRARAKAETFDWEVVLPCWNALLLEVGRVS